MDKFKQFLKNISPITDKEFADTISYFSLQNLHLEEAKVGWAEYRMVRTSIRKSHITLYDYSTEFPDFFKKLTSLLKIITNFFSCHNLCNDPLSTKGTTINLIPKLEQADIIFLRSETSLR